VVVACTGAEVRTLPKQSNVMKARLKIMQFFFKISSSFLLSIIEQFARLAI
jgi:hypothetical protein